MVSYPGEILARFGRYEAVENIGPVERGLLWRAWDPYLERYVVVASLPDVDAAELHRLLPELDHALRVWLGGEDPDAILDFAPGNRREPPFFVFPMPEVRESIAAREAEAAARALEVSLGQEWARVLRRTGAVIGAAVSRAFKRVQEQFAALTGSRKSA